MADLTIFNHGEIIRLAANGDFYFGAQLIEHPKVLKMLQVGLIALGDGKFGYKLGPNQVEIEVEDVPHFVTGIYEEDDGLWISTTRGFMEQLDLPSLRYEQEIPYCRLQCGQPAKFRPTTAVALAEWLEFEDDKVYLVVGNKRRIVPGAKLEND